METDDAPLSHKELLARWPKDEAGEPEAPAFLMNFPELDGIADMTAAMLEMGKAAAERDRLQNIKFMQGNAAELPFADGSFDIAFSRLAFHHFPEPETPFSEMARVLKPGGKLVMIDMAAAEEPLRKTEDALEILGDPSHVRNLIRSEMLALYEARGLFVERCETVRMPVRFDSRMTHTAANQRSCLISAGR